MSLSQFLCVRNNRALECRYTRRKLEVASVTIIVKFTINVSRIYCNRIQGVLNPQNDG